MEGVQNLQSTTEAEREVETQSEEPQAGPSSWPVAPVYRWDVQPKKQTSARLRDSGTAHNFYRQARWCADGSAVLTTAEDRTMRVYECSYEDDAINLADGKSYAQPDAVHAVQWYPSASTASPETFCFMASVNDTSVRLIDASDGRVRASYPIIDHRERYVSPHCMAFNPSSSKVYCGHENAIEVLDIANPGHDTSERLKTSISRKEASGQKGIISSIAFCSDYAGSYAAGSYNGTVALYSEDTAATPLLNLEGVHATGVTHLAFHPLAPTTLFVGSRRSDSIQVYDLRDVSAPVISLARKGSTNQRLWFDVDPWGRYLSSGDEEGTVSVWDITDLTNDKPIFSEQLCDDAVGSIQLHPFKPLLLGASGSRSYLHTDNDYDSTDESDISDDDADEPDDYREANQRPVHGRSVQPVVDHRSSSLSIWSFM